MTKHKLLISWIIIFFGFAIVSALLIITTSNFSFFLLYMLLAPILIFLFCPICIIDVRMNKREEKKKMESQEQIHATEKQISLEYAQLDLEQKKLELCN